MTKKDIVERLRALAYDAKVWSEFEEYDMVCIAQAADEIERLRAALMISRGQWIHSVNAKQCLEALGELPAEPISNPFDCDADMGNGLRCQRIKDHSGPHDGTWKTVAGVTGPFAIEPRACTCKGLPPNHHHGDCPAMYPTVTQTYAHIHLGTMAEPREVIHTVGIGYCDNCDCEHCSEIRSPARTNEKTDR